MSVRQDRTKSGESVSHGEVQRWRWMFPPVNTDAGRPIGQYARTKVIELDLALGILQPLDGMDVALGKQQSSEKSMTTCERL